MTVRCPQCTTIVPLSDEEIGAEGRMVRCAGCGLRWLARVFQDDPYARLPAVRRMTVEEKASEALVIDHIGSGFAKAKRKAPAATPAATVPGRPWLKVFGGIFGAIIAVVILRAPILAALPGVAGLPAETAMLEFRDVKSETMEVRGADTLFVEGTIVNRSADPVALPAIRVTLRSVTGEAVTSWLVEPALDGLAPGASVGFRSALAAPPPDAAKVTLNLTPREGA